MGLDQADLEGEAEAVYKAAGLDGTQAVEPLWLAERILGPGTVIGIYALSQPGGGCLVRVNGQRRIYYRNRLPQQRRDFVVAHELAHAVLGDRGGDELETENACDALAAILIAPRRAFLVALREHGARFTRLAKVFASSESLVALRLGEVTGEPLALIAPRSVRVRGADYSWPQEAELRELAVRPKPGLRKATLRDDGRRVALRSR